MEGPLSGIRILDLSQAASGPFGSMFLGDLGAEVIKIEAGPGDMGRATPGPSFKGESYHYLAYNRNKKGICLDLRTGTGKEAFYGLVKISDVVWDNYRPGIVDRLGIDYETLKNINGRIICCSISGYGSSGPYRDRSAWDTTISALTGLSSVIGEPKGPPLWTQIPFVDFTSGITAALATVAAIVHREHTGQGQRIELAMFDVAVSLLAHFASRYLLAGELPQRLGSGHHATVPFGIFPTKEGYISLGPCWPRICRVLGVEWLIDDPRFATQAARVKHREEFHSIISELFLQEKAEDWLALFEIEDIPAAPVNTLDKAFIDPQVLHNNMVLTLQHSLGGEIKLAGNPIKMPSIKGEPLSPPTLGQQTEEILSQLLNYSQERIDRLKQEEKEHADELKSHVRKAI